MREHDEHPYLAAYWRQRPIAAREFIRLAHQFLSKLEQLSPVFGERCVVIGDETKPTYVPRNYEQFESVISKALDDPNYLYENPDPSRTAFTLDSKFSKGFRVTFSDCRAGVTQDTAVSVAIKAGSYGPRRPAPNLVLIELPSKVMDSPDLQSVRQKLADLVVDVWRPSFAVLSSRELRDALDPANQQSFTLGPLTYFVDERATEICIDDDAVRCRRDRLGGVFLEIDCSAPWVESVEKFRSCFNKLASAGFLKWPSA